MSLKYDPKEAVAELGRLDKKLARLIRKVGPCTLSPPKMQSPFQALARSIIYQQLSGKAAGTIHSRVEALFPRRKGLKPQDILDSPDDELRSAGVSRNKIAALKDLSAKTFDGTVPTLAKLKQMEDEEIIERLVQVRGIGQWTVEMLLIFRLGRPDVLPVNDLGVRKGFSITYKTRDLPAPSDLLEYGERWRPWRSVASWYLWRANEL